MNLNEINGAIGVVNASLPVLTAAYTILRSIWLRTNPPGQSEADFLEYLRSASQTNIDDTAALLRADGYVEQADGSWKKASVHPLAGTGPTGAST